MSADASASDMQQAYRAIVSRCAAAAGPGRSVQVVAVSKRKPAEAVQALYDVGHRVFGENYVQEVVDKAAVCPADVQVRSTTCLFMAYT